MLCHSISESLRQDYEDLKVFWSIWKRVAHRIGNFQARVLLTILYAVILLPFGVISRLFSDPLQLKHRPTKWMDHPPEVHDLPWALKQ
jgi:hypothetical protein